MIKTIFKRRSVRKFKDEPLQDEELGLLLQCAMAAPSANNLKAWHFVVVTKRERLNQLGGEIHPHGKMLTQRPQPCYYAATVCFNPISAILH